MNEQQTHHRRILQELSGLVGHADKVERLYAGGAIRIDNYAVWFVHDESFDLEHMFVYVDLGAPSDPLNAYKRILKLNFDLGAGRRGVFSLHPDNDNVLYAFRYPLNVGSSGKDLLDTLLRFAGGGSWEDIERFRQNPSTH